MIKGKKHLTQDNRYVIQDMLYDKKSATQIAQNIGVHTSTITREIKNNRLVKIPNRTYALRSRICEHKDKCDCKRSLCEHCVNPNSLCKECKSVIVPRCVMHLYMSYVLLQNNGHIFVVLIVKNEISVYFQNIVIKPKLLIIYIVKN